MKGLLKLLSLEADHQKQVVFLMTLISILYLYNFSINDIWTPNESFYAESVREMFESGNFLDIQYNYEPRYNKPPLTYWLIAASASVFGLNEFGIRLPIILLTIGSVWLTYLLGKKLYGQRGGIYALVIMAVSVQLMAVKQYASPEIPLTFFFTLTLYWFIKAYQENKTKYYYLAYVALGLTVLTKGYPYIVVIAGIIGLFTLLDNGFNLKSTFKKTGQFKLHFGVPIVLIIGLSWVIYMYLNFGSDFWEIFQRETFDRAFTRNEKSMRPFFYVEVISWTILPYSLAFFIILGYYLFKFKKIKKEIALAFSWFIVMFVIFTAAKGKIPTYFIQAHPAIALMITAFLLNPVPYNSTLKRVIRVPLIAIGVLIMAISFYTVHFLELSYVWYLLPIIFTGVIVLIFINKKRGDEISTQVAIPFYAILSVYILVAAFLVPIEQFRPYKKIGSVIKERNTINDKTPILIEKTLIHNIPFYAERRAIRDQTIGDIQNYSGQTLALVRHDTALEIEGFETLWSGLIYDFPSESQFAKFVMACLKAKNGDLSQFEEYSLILKQ
ncbi:MAG: phospholipid carrier-dependent glycosyltransferase [Cytophagales bacterium CG12_big_fil_rev_8_21_14_0_65_40_12]|nr:MAG: phospholipid carrier-dependent glycosyltransferase [Cytophagales bacterium CG12_big_fil_rev_8_21_14_0_65_40_12]